MESKKSPRLNLEKGKIYRFQIGIVLGLSLALVAFEWSHIEYTPTIKYAVEVGEETEIMKNYKIIKDPIPELKKVKKPSDQINVVKDIVEPVVKKEEPVKQAEPIKDVVLSNMPFDEEEEEEEPEIFTFVEEMPEFIGGEEAMYKFIGKNVKFPFMAKEARIQGIVYLTFIVMEDGTIDEIKVMRGIGGGCDEEAIRVIKAMPNWKPGKQRGRPVRVQFNMPFRFTLKKG
ncbi:MAG: energy transducer TonB [Crocinitomicaceae bacterium]|nr:energy transducer TonB [Crocinitomicaceae bacterium]|tara:strand:- start:25239 stop:25928 length:690 start_codon:yes stop_codon:yes gene_type:complete